MNKIYFKKSKLDIQCGIITTHKNIDQSILLYVEDDLGIIHIIDESDIIGDYDALERYVIKNVVQNKIENQKLQDLLQKYKSNI